MAAFRAWVLANAPLLGVVQFPCVRRYGTCYGYVYLLGFRSLLSEPVALGNVYSQVCRVNLAAERSFLPGDMLCQDSEVTIVFIGRFC